MFLVSADVSAISMTNGAGGIECTYYTYVYSYSCLIWPLNGKGLSQEHSISFTLAVLHTGL